MCNWIDINEQEPDDESMIVFIPADNWIHSRIGFVNKETQEICCRDAEIGFRDILYYIQLPEEPEY